MPILDDIATHLETAGVGEASTGWPIVKGSMPEDPDGSGGNKCIAVYELPGEAPIEASTTPIDLPGIQVKVRGEPEDYEAARAKMQDVIDALSDATIAGYVFCYQATSAPLALGLDGNRRPQFVMGFNLMAGRS